MSINVALQSVAFYVLSCSTCAKFSHRRKIKSQAKRERAEKEVLEAKNPDLYRHPAPFSTNQYWNEDIMMGPSLSKKNERGASKYTSSPALDNFGQPSSHTTSNTVNSDTPSSPTVVTDISRMSGDCWNINRYQREDEALWGYDYPKPGQILKDAVAKAGSAAGRLLEGGLNMIGSTKEESNGGVWPNCYVRNPPVNDLHPPIVSKIPSNLAETRWMLQPPPSAKVMEGKQKVGSLS